MGKSTIWRKLRKAIPVTGLAAVLAVSPVAAANPELSAAAADAEAVKSQNIQVQILGINDFHGQLNVTRKVGGKDVGRADYLATYLKEREATNKNTLLVHAGDVVGASAPVSSLLQDEPTIEILNELGFDLGVPGNHEFDEGVDEMMRLIYGGYHPKTGKFKGAKFPYVLANVVDKSTNEPILPPFHVQVVNGVKIGFIGVVLSDTPSIVIPSGVKDVQFTDEAEAINKYAKLLKNKGVKSIIVLAHNPGTSRQDGSNPTGEAVEIANAIDDEVDVIFAGHSHQFMNAVVDGKLIVQSYAYGTAFSDVDLEIDKKTGDIVSKKTEIVTTFHEGKTPDPAIKAMIEKYEAQVAPIVNEVVGTAADDLPYDDRYEKEVAIGNLIADAQRATMKTDFSFMNPGGIRTSIDKGEVTWGELYTVQPFNNDLVKMTLTGEQIRKLLEQQWYTKTDGSIGLRTLQISGLKYTRDKAARKILDITLPDGTPIDPKATYTVTVNSFLADGGDNFTVLKEGQNREVGPTDIDALVNYIKQLTQPFSAAVEGRITEVAAP
ncbi:bifunctional metallophosphatase/5'-nucleotidase [Effusibacillus lacus]|uniref:Bifunctional metallophosphatase/5'-nucleotidase n=1 Tax=Effusibacillus lacus TaxID=1348429 RepID=A0A292YGC8_9BACL|nr:5'-nucleotidase C-terminal domain-containing protein [Effusibacillus lacus]TCS70499.1 5'-nucleotidase [Effusibacillus lacus]GAX89547.1 bifunctional metallophosphatase/5'-nucleotidase [Effusibacillus lacus]